jgi:hypothetical protein
MGLKGTVPIEYAAFELCRGVEKFALVGDTAILQVVGVVRRTSSFELKRINVIRIGAITLGSINRESY